MAQSSIEVKMRRIKNRLLCFTASFVLLSLLIISMGTSIYSNFEEINFFVYNHFYKQASFIIAIGVIMMFVSILGTIGVYKKSAGLIYIFAVLMSLVFILEVAVAIKLFKFRDKINDVLDKTLAHNIQNYYDDSMVQRYFNLLQDRRNCCGVSSYRDWGDVMQPSNERSGIVFDNMTIPVSCCAESYDLTKEDIILIGPCSKLYAQGCLSSLYNTIYRIGGLLGAGILTIAFIQIIGVVLSFIVASATRKATTERELLISNVYDKTIFL